MPAPFKAILIGGSAGSLAVVTQILRSIPAVFPITIIIVMHRLKNVISEMDKVLSTHPGHSIIEPQDKEPVSDGCIYLAPQNYHLLIEADNTFSLDYSEAVRFSRPSIDVTFESAANVYKNETLAILLSGANSDGAMGMQSILQKGGAAIAQDPQTAEYSVMPQAALNLNSGALSLSPGKIITFINQLVVK